MKLKKSFLSLSSVSFLALVSGVCFAQQAPANTDSGAIQVAGNSAQAPASPPQWINFVLIGGIILFMWLFVFRPQSKRAKEQKEFLASLTPGAEVITTGGIIGTVTEVKENIVSLNIGNNANIRVLKNSISGKLNAATETK